MLKPYWLTCRQEEADEGSDEDEGEVDPEDKPMENFIGGERPILMPTQGDVDRQRDLEEALLLQMDMQKRLHEQLVVGLNTTSKDDHSINCVSLELYFLGGFPTGTCSNINYYSCCCAYQGSGLRCQIHPQNSIYCAWDS